MQINPILLSDSYKYSMWLSYPKNATYVSSYFEARGGDYPETIFFGLQMILQEHFSTPVTMADVDEAEEIITGHGCPFNRKGWELLVTRHGGKWPVVIDAVPEGTWVPYRNVLLQIRNTDPDFAWLTTYFETVLSHLWYTNTVATRSGTCRKIITKWLDKTSDLTAENNGILFRLHDFGYRGTETVESAGFGGVSHLVNFMGTDTVAALVAGRRYYDCPMAGFSIPATEHSVITSWGGPEKEEAAHKNFLDVYLGDGKLVASVSDSYDIFRTCREIWGGSLKQQILDSGGKVVVRPDSGNPPEIMVEVTKILDAQFGSTVNSKGYKVIHPAIGGLQGDGVSEQAIDVCCKAVADAGYSNEFWAFGMGGQLLQVMDRDTSKYAFKASSISFDQEPTNWQAFKKDPVTDKGKLSKAGRLALVKTNGSFETIQESDLGNRQNILQPVFRNGELLTRTTLDEIRNRAWPVA